MIDNQAYNEKKIIKQTIDSVALQELAMGNTIPIADLKTKLEAQGVCCSTKNLINFIASVASKYVIKGDNVTAKRVINTFTIGLKELWVTHYVWEAKYKKSLQEYLWRELIPYDIIEQIDFESLVEAKQQLTKQNAECEGELRILKTVFQNGRQYDLIIDVKDPRYDWWGDSYQFFIRFTDRVNQVPLIYDNLCIKVVIPCIKCSDILNKYGISALMVYEPGRGRRRGGLLWEQVTDSFSNILFKKDLLTAYNSSVFKNILFNYLVFFEIGKYSDKDSYTVGFYNNSYYAFWIADNIYACVIDQCDVHNVINAATLLLSFDKLPKDRQLVVVSLDDVFSIKLSDSVLNGMNVSVISIEDYYQNNALTEEVLTKYKEQVNFLRSISNNALIEPSKDDNDRWDILSTVKIEDDLTREVNSESLTMKNGIWFAKRPKKVYQHSIRHKITSNYSINWIGKKWFIKNENVLIPVKGQPEDVPSQKGRKLCHFDPKAIAKLDRTRIYEDNKKTIIIEPENKNTFCRIDKSLFDDAVKVLNNGIKNLDNRIDWFRYLCAANLINAYKKYYDKSVEINLNDSLCQLVIKYLASNSDRDTNVITVHYSDIRNVSLMVSIEVNYRRFQFYFRGIGQKDFEGLKVLKVKRGNWEGIKLQPIAPLLYQYSLSL